MDVFEILLKAAGVVVVAGGGAAALIALNNEAEPLMKSLEEAIHGGLRDGHISSPRAVA